MGDIGDQVTYGKAVSKWCQFHDNPDDNNENKINPANRGLCLLSNLYRRAEDYVVNIQADILSSDDAGQMIADRIHERDTMSVTSLVFNELTTMHNTVRDANESFYPLEALLSAQVTTFNGLALKLPIPD